jgi:acetyltransferase-like isoleucine patch superfamily enzyme
VISLELLWWIGLAWFSAWVALPLLVMPLTGPVFGVVVWCLLAPWSALVGMASLHRLLPASAAGTFKLFSDRGAVHWALKGWAPSLYLTVFQPVAFMSEGFQRLALRAFGARLAPGALLTSRTIVREPHHLTVGAASLIGEYVHLICSYQPRPKLLVVGPITIGERVLVGAYSHLGPGVQIGADCFLEYAVRVGANSTVGAGTRIGAGSSIYNTVHIGAGVTIGKGCLIPSGIRISDGARIPDGTILVSGG